ncbi:MAG TPA: triple tyrosine motif-containing protein, partial [Vicinamibacterales bacterium]|nr:triple tyrosine motif-containing protein [Vicinamibacterales bacterium]
MSVLDPRRLSFSKLPPPVRIEQISADGTNYSLSSEVRLPPLIRDLGIDYTALTFVAPERVVFRTKLDGRDREWQDVGRRRQAIYTNLRPGRYRFRVTASNNGDVWNEAEASTDLVIAPAYYQTTWFLASSVAIGLALLWTLHQWRLRQTAHVFDARLQERLNERTRIARDLHDTLLQSFHGLLLRFRAASLILPERPLDAKRELESAIDQAAQAITEGRDAVQNLRSSTVVAYDLAVAIGTLGQDLAAARASSSTTTPAAIDVTVEGVPRDLHPIVRDDAYRIAAEGVRNAFRHACARRVEVEIQYGDAQF